jgi:hypothetical protein
MTSEQKPMNLPWSHLIDEDRDGVWAGFGAYKHWLRSKMQDDAACAYDEAGDIDAWKENLYAIVADIAADHARLVEMLTSFGRCGFLPMCDATSRIIGYAVDGDVGAIQEVMTEARRLAEEAKPKK